MFCGWYFCRLKLWFVRLNSLVIVCLMFDILCLFILILIILVGLLIFLRFIFMLLLLKFVVLFMFFCFVSDCDIDVDSGFMV